MFFCDSCGVLTKSRETANKIVTERRQKKYQNKKINNRDVFFIDTEGWEIVKEISVCKDCYSKHKE